MEQESTMKRAATMYLKKFMREFNIEDCPEEERQDINAV